MFDLGTNLSDMAKGAMTRVSSNGIVTVRMSQTVSLSQSNYNVEFLRGESTMDECQSLFKDYKACLGVSTFGARVDRKS